MGVRTMAKVSKKVGKKKVVKKAAKAKTK